MFIINWIKQNKLTSILIVILLFVIPSPFKSRINSYQTIGFNTRGQTSLSMPVQGESMDFFNQDMVASKTMLPPVYPGSDPAPQADVANRLVIEDSQLSLLVKNVTEVRNQIVSYAQTAGGYMVNSNISNPQDAPTATVTIRVPSVRLEEALTYLRGLSVKVVSENLEGQDVTDQYVDIEANIENLVTTKARFEEILRSATEISDITNLNQQIIYLQQQIDSYKGQQVSLSKNAELAKVTIYLSTDEIALPYAPNETWRPNVIFKLAVRSLISHVRELGTALIWIIVYAVIWIPISVLIWFGYRKFVVRK